MMIGYIKGRVTAIFPECCFLETAGIGYRIFVSAKDRENLQNGQDVKLLTYMAVREDAICLYGFLSKESYDLFLVLISISKIGPKVAMGILSTVLPTAFIQAIRAKDMSILTKLPGVGKKTAERLVVELKDKMGTDEEIDSPGANMEDSEGPVQEAARYLQALGYENNEFALILRKISPECQSVSQMVQGVLREFGKKNNS